ncbi:MAG: PAS domain-containing protein [Candidatus Accumulibacter delftensis]
MRPETLAALRDSEARFRAMSDASPLGIFVSDAQGWCVYTNAAYHKISGLSFDETLGTNWSRAIHPDDRQRVLAEWQAKPRAAQDRSRRRSASCSPTGASSGRASTRPDE